MKPGEVHTLRVPREAAGRRLDAWLAEALPEHSRSALRRAIEAGQVSVDGTLRKPSHTLRGEEQVLVTLAPPSVQLPAGEAIPLAIVFEDEHLLIVDKPPGLVVHPARGHGSGTLVNALLHHRPEIGGVGGVGRPGIVHRLDRGTSGLLLVAKNERAHRGLSEALRRREIARRYEALAWGTEWERCGVIEGPIGRDPRHRLRMAVVEGGKPARTHFEVLGRSPLVVRLALRLETGRTHQIRVHLAHTGRPIVGDDLYGGRSAQWLQRLHRIDSAAAAAVRRVARPLLHAVGLSLIHPVTGDRLECTAPVPEDFLAAARALGLC